jgi:nucleoid DNA-binding protein
MSTKLIMPEVVINQVITHQFDGAHDAVRTNDSVEISGFGKFLFNEKKAKQKVEKLQKIKKGYEKMLQDKDIPLKKSNFIKSKLSNLNVSVNSLKPKIEKNEDSGDIRGVEE